MEHFLTFLTFIEKDTRIFRHDFFFRMSALRTGYDRCIFFHDQPLLDRKSLTQLDRLVVKGLKPFYELSGFFISPTLRSGL